MPKTETEIQAWRAVPLQTMSTLTDTLKIGIIGTGGRGVGCFGKLLRQHDDVQLFLADANAQRVQEAAQELGGAQTYHSIEGMLGEAQLDGVVITTPDFMHADHVIAALESGVRHVIVDKPLAITTEGCLRVIDAMHATGGKVAIGFNLRHAPLIDRIKTIIDSGDIGDLMLMENREFYDGGRTYMARWNRKYAWSGGLWIHKGSHDFDVFNWWNAGGDPVRVFASGGLNALRPDKLPFALEEGKTVGPNCANCDYYEQCPDHSALGQSDLFNAQTATEDGYVKDLCIFLSDKDVHDNGIALVEYDNNVRMSHMECFVCGFDDRMYTVVGDRGTLMANLHNPERIELRPRWGETKIIDVPLPEEGGHGGADPLLVQNFIASLKGEGHPSASVRDGIKAVAVGQAAEISWREQRKVDISELVNLSDSRLLI
jgi:predicted dehydrogenase